MFAGDNVSANAAQISAKVELLSKVVWPALATLAPAAITAVFKWVQDHSYTKRRVVLCDRMVDLAKSISALPENHTGVATVAGSPREVLTHELDLLSSELRALHIKSEKQALPGGSFGATAASRLREALLLYRPYGFVAWLLHLIFFAYLGALLLGLIGLIDEMKTNPHGSDFTTGLIGFTMFGIPPLIIRHFASKLHRAHARAAAQATTQQVSAMRQSA